MPTADAGTLTTIRKHPATVQRYLSIAARTTVFAAQVNGAPSKDTQNNAIYQFGFDNVTTGAYTDVEAGMTADIGTTPGARDVGSVRVRKAPTSGVFYIAATPAAALNVQDNYYITVKNEFRPWQVQPRLKGIKNSAGYINSFTEYHDYDIAYSDQNADIRPKANITASGKTPVKPADFLDDGETYRTVNLDSSESLAFATSATITGVLWDVGDGTITVGTATDTAITVQFPAGERYITLTVTDTNGTTDIMRYYLWAHDPDVNPPLSNFKVTRDTRRDGREMSFTFFGDDDEVDETVIPEGSLVCYWKVVDFDSDAAPAQYIDSFWGWAVRDSLTLRLYRTLYALDVAGPAFWLDKFDGRHQTITDTGSTPNRWYRMQNLTLDRIAHYLLREYSTVLTLVNYYPTGVTTTLKKREIQKASIWRQLGETLKSNLFSVVGCDSLGAIWCRRDYSYLETSERSARDKVMSITKADWRDDNPPDLTTEKVAEVGWVIADGSYYSGGKSYPLYSRAPGLTPAYGAGEDTAPFQYVSSTNAQTTLNRLGGHHFAVANNPRPSLSIELVGNYDILEPCWNEPVTVTWTDDSVRGTQLVSAEFMVKAITVQNSNERGQAAERITWELAQVTSGLPCETHVPPKSPVNKATWSNPTIEFPKQSFPLFQTAAQITGGIDTLCLFRSDGHLNRTSQFSGVPFYDDVDLSASIPGTWLLWIPNPVAPTNGVVITSTHFAQLNNIFDAVPSVANLTALPTTSLNRSADASIASIGHLVIITFTAGVGTTATYSTDAFSASPTLTTVTITGEGMGSSPTPICMGCWVAQTGGLSGKVYAGAARPGSAADVFLYVSNDYGATWAITNGASNAPYIIPDERGAGDFGVPRINNANGLIAYGTEHANVVANQSALVRANGTVQTAISPTYSGTHYGVDPNRSRGVINMLPNSDKILFFAGTNIGRTAYGMWVTQNAPAASVTYTEIIPPTLAAGVDYRRGFLTDAMNVFVWGLNGAIGYLDYAFGGGVIADKRGNLSTAAEIIAIAGG